MDGGSAKNLAVEGTAPFKRRLRGRSPGCYNMDGAPCGKREVIGDREMILSVSRRTDIPAYYAPWFMNRLRAGEVYYPLHGSIGRVALSPEWVDCIVFWTKNPLPILPFLPEIEAMGYQFYFTVTVTPYEAPLERGLLPEARINGFRRLSALLGPDRVDWRYDPVLLGGKYTVPYHLDQFQRLCERLHTHTARCVISFADSYPHADFTGGSPAEMYALGEGFAQIAAGYRLPLSTCAEPIDLSGCGIRHGACIDREKIEALLGWPLAAKKDPGQRKDCGCVESVDIGVYDTCPAGCAYCYATTDPALALARAKSHQPTAPMLTGWPTGTERVIDRTGPTLKRMQTSLY